LRVILDFAIGFSVICTRVFILVHCKFGQF